MTFERPKDFKISLSKTIEFLSFDDDLLKRNPKDILEREQFRAQVVSLQDPSATEMVYQFSKGENVLATFEKLKREVMEIQFAALLQRKPMLFTPVESYECKSSREESQIKFVTYDSRFQRVNIVLKLANQPKSALSQIFNKTPGKFIHLSVGKKVPPTEKLKESFTKFVTTGGLLVDFITDTLRPTLTRVFMHEKEKKGTKRTNKNHKKREKTNQENEIVRASSGNDRAPRNGVPRNVGLRKGSQEKKIESHNSHIRGDPIPRRNIPMNSMRGSKSPVNSRSDFMSGVSNPSRGTRIGGSFGQRRQDSTTSGMTNHNTFSMQGGQEAIRRDVIRGVSQRRGIGRGHEGIEAPGRRHRGSGAPGRGHGRSEAQGRSHGVTEAPGRRHGGSEAQNWRGEPES